MVLLKPYLEPFTKRPLYLENTFKDGQYTIVLLGLWTLGK